ncbi:hypothetical protein HY407_02930 [Candidatus Gottesmanbacteria bacterium]|nr:hypothetical protein [Candidatus Gottesmanbacteria bacterium]
METAIFWIAWGIISFWALKTFYYSFSKEKLGHLRKANIGFSFAVLILYFLPWVPLSMDGWTGFGLAWQGNFLAALFFIFLLISLVLFFQKEYIFLKIASVLTVLLTLDLFVLMLMVRPGTFTLSLYDIAPIVAVLILLVADVSVLLLWQQMQLAPKLAVMPDKKKKIGVGAASVLIVILGLSVWLFGNTTSISEPSEKQMAETVEEKEIQGFEEFASLPAGVVCGSEKKFSFQMNTSYTIMSDNGKGISMLTDFGLVTVATGESFIDRLKDFGVTYEKDGDTYFYEIPASGSAQGRTDKRFGMSQAKDGWLVSVFYTKENEGGAKQIFSSVLESLKDGC